MSVDVEAIKDTKSLTDVVYPSKYHVILINDDYTPMEFVITILGEIFNHTEQKANELTLEIHNKGQAVVGTYTYEIAEQKAAETMQRSRQQSFPLAAQIEKA